MSLQFVWCEASGEQCTLIITVPVGKYNLPLYSLFFRDVLGWKAGLSMLLHRNRVLDAATKPSFNQALWRRIHFGGQDGDSGKVIEAGGSRTSLGGGFLFGGC